MYQPSCEDIGAFIYVKVRPLEAAEGYTGEAEAKYGPVLMDPNLRKTLESVLVSGGSRFSCALITRDESGVSSQDAVLTVSRELLDLKVVDRDGRIDSVHSFNVNYSVDNPMLVMSSDTKKLTVVFEDKPFKLPLRILSRQSRDLIVLSIRCLAMRNYLINTKALKEVFQGEVMQQAQGEQQSSLDLALELEGSIREIKNLLVVNKAVTIEKNRLKRELVELEDSINETIGSYQSLLANEESMNSASAQEDEIMRLKHELDRAIVNKRTLAKKLDEANSELEQVRQETQRVDRDRHQDASSSKNSLLSLEAQLAFAKEELKRVGSEQGSWTHELKRAMESNHELRAQLAQLKEDHLKDKLNAAEDGELEKLRAENESLREDNEALLGQRSFMSKKIETLNTQLTELASENERTKQLLAATQQQAEQDRQALIEHVSSPVVEDSQSVVQALENEISKYREQCDSLSAQLSRAQAANRRAR